MNYGLNVKRIRESMGDTQEQLADKIGVSRSYIAMLERGSKQVTVPIANQIADIYGVDVTELCR